jgi:hypothetical protein
MFQNSSSSRISFVILLLNDEYLSFRYSVSSNNQNITAGTFTNHFYGAQYCRLAMDTVPKDPLNSTDLHCLQRKVMACLEIIQLPAP